jgi:hypothetical protein
MDLAPDLKTKQLFKQVRGMWIALADESPNLPSRVIAASVAGIEEMQSTFEDFLLTEIREPADA